MVRRSKKEKIRKDKKNIREKEGKERFFFIY